MKQGQKEFSMVSYGITLANLDRAFSINEKEAKTLEMILDDMENVEPDVLKAIRDMNMGDKLRVEDDIVLRRIS